MAGGYLSINIEGHGGLAITRQGDAILKGEAGFEYREIPKHGPARQPRRAAAKRVNAGDDVDPALLSALKALRRDLAAKRNVPAYIVFSDATLIDICRLKPESLDQMARVGGVGPKKLADFGAAFLDALRRAP